MHSRHAPVPVWAAVEPRLCHLLQPEAGRPVRQPRAAGGADLRADDLPHSGVDRLHCQVGQPRCVPLEARTPCDLTTSLAPQPAAALPCALPQQARRHAVCGPAQRVTPHCVPPCTLLSLLQLHRGRAAVNTSSCISCRQLFCDSFLPCRLLLPSSVPPPLPPFGACFAFGRSTLLSALPYCHTACDIYTCILTESLTQGMAREEKQTNVRKVGR